MHPRVFFDRPPGAQVLLLALLMAIVPVAYMAASRTPSAACGPFAGRRHAFTIVSETVEADFPAWLRTVLRFVATAGFGIPAITFFLVLAYYLRTKAEATRRGILQLKHWLHLERTETIRLLRARPPPRLAPVPRRAAPKAANPNAGF